ncbi:MAG: F0F1 ATP synthase subunit B [Candidatus Marinamargulisbacteria bacterium]
MISINPYEIILQIINFGILYLLLKKFLAAPLSNFLANRSNLIKHNIETSEMNKKKSEDILAQQKDTLKQAQLEAQSIRNKAEESAQNELASVVEKGKQSAEQMLAQAKQDIDVQTNNARKTLLKDVADLAVKVVQKFVVTEVSEKDKKATIDKLVEQVADK